MTVSESLESVGAPAADAYSGRRLRALLRRPSTLCSLIMLGLFVVLGLFGSAIAPQGPNQVDVSAMLTGPSRHHWFGTDELGRDVLSRVVLAARVSLEVALSSVLIALAAGLLIGLLAGYYRGAVDSLLMRVMDVLFAFPVMLLAIAIVAILGPGLGTAIIAIGVVYTPIFARVTRSSVLSVRAAVYVRAAESIGTPDWRIIATHVLPNVAGPVIVQTSLSFGFAILSEAALSFLGLGVQPPQPSWGQMLYDARGFVTGAWWMGVFPGVAIVLTVLAFNLLGDALRDVLDPRLLSKASARP